MTHILSEEWNVIPKSIMASDAGIELKEVNVDTTKKTKDDRSFRPESVAELNALANYEPLVWNIGGKTIPIGCGNDLEDVGIITSCYLTLWSLLVAFYALLLKAAIDTDERSTTLFSFLFMGVFFVAIVGGAVYTGQMELDRAAKARALRAQAKLAGGEGEVVDEEEE
ncbi:hypothetical protein ScalyP_jg2320 [Parmales sp. scaly parma]|nr:hypothetical protein ScalyP_jg2320 [Parmales sp. scaly parma]